METEKYKNLVKYIDNQIVIWENWYGTWYNYVYDSDGKLRRYNSELEQDQYIKLMREAWAVLETLKKIRRNGFKGVKRPEKRKYKINYIKGAKC